MFREPKRTRVVPSVKLFPRLVNSNPPTSQRDAEALKVRTRLLEMILDNERDRRGDWRPTAG